MNCDFCNKPAVVHEVTVKNGVKKEVHLCEEHAAESGISMPGQQPINQLLTQFVISHPSGAGGSQSSRAGARRQCPECGMSYTRFRKTGILGCSHCYDAFGDQLAPLIERAQNSGSHHTGKAPKRAGKSIDLQLQRQRLLRQLDEAIDAEQYERAAKLRDALNELQPDELAVKDGGGDQPQQGKSRG